VKQDDRSQEIAGGELTERKMGRHLDQIDQREEHDASADEDVERQVTCETLLP
jgi:hypothetical protein